MIYAIYDNRESRSYCRRKIIPPIPAFYSASNWMNDPNGMFYFNGKYHLYFQHYPDKNVWGPMHWGHAESEDMIHWEEQPIALYPDEKGYIFSGSAVVDHNNTSGFGEGKTSSLRCLPIIIWIKKKPSKLTSKPKALPIP